MLVWVNKLVERISSTVASSKLQLTGGQRIRRSLFLIGTMLLLMVLPIPLNEDWAIPAAGVLFLLLLLSVGSFTVLCHRVVHQLSKKPEVCLFGGRVHIQSTELQRPVATVEGWSKLIHRVGVAIPALVFFCGWALLYSLLWLQNPGHCPADPAGSCSFAFAGTGPHPTFGSFLYFSINEAFANPPPDFFPTTKFSRAFATIEVLSGILLVTLYASSFFGLRRTEETQSSRAQQALDTPPANDTVLDKQ